MVGSDDSGTDAGPNMERFRPGEEVQNSQNEWISNLGENGEQNHESQVTTFDLVETKYCITLLVYTTAETSDVTRRL